MPVPNTVDFIILKKSLLGILEYSNMDWSLSMAVSQLTSWGTAFHFHLGILLVSPQFGWLASRSP